MHSAARSAAHEDEKVEFASQAGAASPHRTVRREAPHMKMKRLNLPYKQVRLRRTVHREAPTKKFEIQLK
jgi:hypothetical protein